MKKRFKLIELVVSIYRKTNDCIIKTSRYDQTVINLIKTIDKNNRNYNKIDKSWQIKDNEVIDKLIEAFKNQDIKYTSFF